MKTISGHTFPPRFIFICIIGSDDEDDGTQKENLNNNTTGRRKI